MRGEDVYAKAEVQHKQTKCGIIRYVFEKASAVHSNTNFCANYRNTGYAEKDSSV